MESIALDSSVYINALRGAEESSRLARFLQLAGPRLRLSAVVAMALRAGARSVSQIRAVDALIASHGRRERTIVPSVVTGNVRHFAAIHRHLRGFRFVDAAEAMSVVL